MYVSVCIYWPLSVTKTPIWSRKCASTRRAAGAALLNEPLVERTTMRLCGAQEGGKQRAAWSRPAFSGGRERGRRLATQVTHGVSVIDVLMARCCL